MDLRDWQYHESNIPKKDTVEGVQYREKKKQEFIDEIKTNWDKYSDFFNEYNESSFDSFIDQYANHKITLIDLADYWVSQTKESKEMQYQEEVNESFDLILQKKLFNLQLQWRAELVEIPQIRICGDFLFWKKRIRDCPFIDAVTSTEVEIMKRFLVDEQYVRASNSWRVQWQDTKELVKKNKKGDMENYPLWYEYYDLQMGTSTLLLLPDIRGEKEEYYISACLEEEHKKNPIQSDNTFIKPKPGLYGDPKVFNEFINLFEDKYFKFTSEGYINATKDNYDEYEINDDDIDNAIRILQKADERVAMPSSSNWREAVIKCAILYKNGKIANEIDIAYEEYLMLRSAGIGWHLEDYSREYRKERLVKFYEDLILDGREAIGEPRDFNF